MPLDPTLLLAVSFDSLKFLSPRYEVMSKLRIFATYEGILCFSVFAL